MLLTPAVVYASSSVVCFVVVVNFWGFSHTAGGGAEARARLCGSRPITARSALKELQTRPTGVFVVPLDMTSAPFSKAFKVLRHCSQLLLCDSVPPGLRAAWGCTCRTEVQVLGGACCRGPGSHQPC